jgi:amino acid transporter
MSAQIEKAVMIGLLALFAVASLFVAVRGGHGVSYWGGVAFAAVCIGLIFYQISRTRFDGQGKGH